MPRARLNLVPHCPPLEELTRSEAVFAGKVVSVREFRAPFASAYQTTDPTTVEFEVSTVWKGLSYETMFLTTARRSKGNGFPFIEASEYIGYSFDGTSVSLCSRTRSLIHAQQDLDVLGEGGAPKPGTRSPVPTTGSCTLPSYTGSFILDVVGLAIMAGLVRLGLRRWTRRQ